MSAERSIVWTTNDVEALIFVNDADQKPVGMQVPPFYQASDTPALKYAFFESISVEGVLEVAKRPVTGRKVKKIVAQQYDYETSVSTIYFKKEESDIENYFKRTTWLTIVFLLSNPTNVSLTGPIPQKVLLRAKALSFNLVSGSVTEAGNEFIKARARFIAEDMQEQ